MCQIIIYMYNSLFQESIKYKLFWKLIASKFKQYYRRNSIIFFELQNIILYLAFARVKGLGLLDLAYPVCYTKLILRSCCWCTLQKVVRSATQYRTLSCFCFIAPMCQYIWLTTIDLTYINVYWHFKLGTMHSYHIF